MAVKVGSQGDILTWEAKVVNPVVKISQQSDLIVNNSQRPAIQMAKAENPTTQEVVHSTRSESIIVPPNTILIRYDRPTTDDVEYATKWMHELLSQVENPGNIVVTILMGKGITESKGLLRQALFDPNVSRRIDNAVNSCKSLNIVNDTGAETGTLQMVISNLMKLMKLKGNVNYFRSLGDYNKKADPEMKIERISES